MTDHTVVGIAGGSGSGKTTLVASLVGLLSRRSLALIDQDAYYRDRSYLSLQAREMLNYDVPEALDLDLLASHTADLRRDKAVEKPIYDFATHTRLKGFSLVLPGEVIIVEGTLVFSHTTLRSLMDIKVFMDLPADVRLARRILRDVRDRSRSVEAVLSQWLDSVRTMDEQYVAPTKRHADIILTQDPSRNDIEALIERLRGRP